MKFIKYLLPCALVSLAAAQRAGDRQPVSGVHPSYAVTNIRPTAVNFSIGAMDFMSDGRMVVTSWKDPYEVHIIGNAIIGTNPTAATVTTFATGLTEALGLKVVNDSIYVLEKDQITLLLDTDNDGRADEYRAISYDWTKSLNSKEYAMGLAYDGTYFYAAFGDPTISSGTSVDPTPAGRHNGVLRIRRSDGLTEPFAGGLRVPGGVGMAFGQPWISEIQGGYRTSNVFYNPKMGRWYGRPVNPPSTFQPTSRAMNPNTVRFPYTSPEDMFSLATPFVVNIPFKQNSAAGAGPAGLQRSPAQFVEVKTGPFAGQILLAESDNGEGSSPNGSGTGEMVRLFLERTTDGEYQGAAFHFTSNTVFGGATGTTRAHSCFTLVEGPDGSYYCGALGATSAGWGRTAPLGLDRIRLSGAAVPFDMLAVRSMGPNTFEVEFTKPLLASLGDNVTANLTVQKWWDRLSENYGCCRSGAASNTSTSTTGSVATVTITSATVQTDRKKVLVTFPAGQLTTHWQFYFRWTDAMRSDANETLWGTEAFYTLNAFGPGTAPVAIDKVNQRTISSKMPFTVSMAAGGDTRLQLFLAEGTPFQVLITDFSGKILAARKGNGGAEILFGSSEIRSGIHVLKVQAGGRTFSHLISK